jgi:hypothetical protein
MNLRTSHLALVFVLAISFISAPTASSQEVQNIETGYTESGINFKKSNPVPFRSLDNLLGTTFLYQPNSNNPSKNDLGIAVDKVAKVKLINYAVNDHDVYIAVDIEGFGVGRICMDRFYFASSDRAIGFINSPSSFEYSDCKGNATPPDTTISIPTKANATDRNWAVLTEKLSKLKATERSLITELERVKASISEINEKLLSSTGKPKPNWFIKEFGVWTVNSAGGVEPYFIFNNPNEKSAIKYISVQISLFNSVGDMVGSQIGGDRTKGIRFTGPLTHEEGETRASWGPVWYNTTGSCIKIESMTITWMNGKNQTYAGKSLQAAFAPNVENSCRVK